ncbi:TPA: hypothetical protein N0F65_002069 [Lagenidium giganteum]|uniref:Tyrosine-protein kinase ephrin type A/B receptor-like domain-containing protein n=1 Tax=Lagenidium giganteum TaxID=4803 RepID=A0AAV2ZG87_9STRA|nr:TPA: hypothetical protein N0F65_002069 [Lagenidium giganteum]
MSGRRILRGCAVLCGLLLFSTACATVIHINGSTDIRSVFKVRDQRISFPSITLPTSVMWQCSSVRPIGMLNEYYVVCAAHFAKTPNVTKVEIVNVSITGAMAFPSPGAVRVELDLLANDTETALEMRNSSLMASAVSVSAASIAIDNYSFINATAQGLKFGPGYNAWTHMGASYGGIGGATLSFARRTCDDVAPNRYFRAIGSVDGSMGVFRAYGSGGGDSEATRGGGRVMLQASVNCSVDGALLANGGHACTDCEADGAGSGGTVSVTAKHIHGQGAIQANGGNPVIYDHDKGTGGGGGGGGGRIVLQYHTNDIDPTRMQAFGGGVPSHRSDNEQDIVTWCQLGADGTILYVKNGSSDALRAPNEPVGTLLVKGTRLQHVGPVKRIQIYGCTPIFQFTEQRHQPFLPLTTSNIIINGGASVCADYVDLELDTGSQINALDGNWTIHLVASQFKLQGYVGPASMKDDDGIRLVLGGGSIALSNMLALVHRLDVNARSAFTMDKYAIIRFKYASTILSSGQAALFGFLDPIDSPTGASMFRQDPLLIRIAAESIEFIPQTSQLGQSNIELDARKTAVVDLSFETAFTRISIKADNLTFHGASCGPIAECRATDLQSDPGTCERLRSPFAIDSPYVVSVFSTGHSTIGNVTAGSILLCGGQSMTIAGRVQTDQRGCAAGVGPGNSSLIQGASGGAGHGGRGGNVEPDDNGGGIQYDSASQYAGGWNLPWPRWPGSGAKSADDPSLAVGGAGGGLVHVKTDALLFTKEGVISARGGDGTRHGGGGSGGAISMFVRSLAGPGKIDISGGHSVNPSTLDELALLGDGVWQPLGDSSKGGGGGGGVIRVVYLHGANESSGEQFIKDGGKLVTDGGNSNGGQHGKNGVAVGSDCSSGRGGPLCLKCAKGTHSPGNMSICSPCGPGEFAGEVGCANCSACPVGSFNDQFGQEKCSLCAPGQYSSSTGAKKCELCGPGTSATKEGSAHCLPCPKGSIAVGKGSVNCTMCGIGETTAKPGAIVCIPCQDKPPHSSFNIPGQCAYACDKGRIGTDCLTPFERFTKPIGGPLGFVILVFGFTAVLFGSWGFITYRTSNARLRQYTEFKAQTLRDQLSLSNLTRKLTPRLTDQDLKAHVARLYFAGDNHPERPWVLESSYLPVGLHDCVYEGSYQTFAAACNALLVWNPHGWESITYKFVHTVIPPLGTIFMRRRQLVRIERLVQHISGFGGGFFRDISIRGHGAQLKVGFSTDFSLAYIDVLLSAAGGSGVTVKALSLGPETLIVVAGTGSFYRPYHVDTNDIVVRAVPTLLGLLQHTFWIEFIASLNQILRLLPQPSSRDRRTRARKTIEDLIELLSDFNAKHSADNLQVNFGSVDYACPTDTSAFYPLDLAAIDEALLQYEEKPFKFALQVIRPRHHSPTVATTATTSASTAKTKAITSAERRESHDDILSANFRYSQIRLEALFALPDTNDDEQLLSPTKTQRNELPHAGPVSARAWKLVRMALQPIFPLLELHNVRPRASRLTWVFPVLLLSLFVVDGVAMFWILIEYYCVQVEDPTAHDSGCARVRYCMQCGVAAGFYWSLAILPGALVGAPFLGVLFLARKRVFLGKMFVVWNFSSVVNLIVAFVCGLVYVAHVHETVFVVITIAGLIKYVQNALALQCMAVYESERPLRGWRGLYTTRDWYDSSYTPLYHKE